MLLLKKYYTMEIYVLLTPVNQPCPAAQEFQNLVHFIPATATADAFSTVYLHKTYKLHQY